MAKKNNKHHYEMTTIRAYICLAACALCATFTACNSDDDPNYGPSFDSPSQQAAQGTFAGTFSRVQVGTTDTLKAEGTLTITATDTLNRARITYACNDMEELAKTAAFAVNIAHADQGYTIINKSADIALLGRVGNDQNISASFTKAVRSGRKTVRYNYSFDGHRQ